MAISSGELVPLVLWSDNPETFLNELINDPKFCIFILIQITHSKSILLLFHVSDLETVDKIISGK